MTVSQGRPEQMARWHGPRGSLVLGVLVGLLLLSLMMGVWIGSVGIHPLALFGVVWNALPFADVDPWWRATDSQILVGIRLPRVIGAAAVGVALDFELDQGRGAQLREVLVGRLLGSALQCGLHGQLAPTGEAVAEAALLLSLIHI